MNMNANLILAGRQPDTLNALARGQALRAQHDQLQNRNALSEFYQAQGHNVLAGNQNALNSLARLDPHAAVQIQGQHQVQAQRAQAMEYDSLDIQYRLRERAKKASAEEVAATREELKRAVVKATAFAQQGDWDSVNQYVEALDHPPISTMEQFTALVNEVRSWDAVLEEFAAPAKPLSGPGKVQSDIDAGFLPQGTELRSPQVVVNTGDASNNRPIVDKPPKGFQRVWDEKAQSYVDKPIPGGDVSQERNEGARKVELAASNYRRKSDIVNSNIDKAITSLEDNGRWVAGYGSFLSGLPETEARNFQATIDTIKANLGFEELQAMRDSSPTGGALGNVTEREIAFLQAVQGNLDAAQSPKQLLEVLKEIKVRRAEFDAERQAILSKNQTASQAANLSQQVRGLPDFANMSDADLEAWIQENGS